MANGFDVRSESGGRACDTPGMKLEEEGSGGMERGGGKPVR